MLAGIDTHKDTLAVAVIDDAGRPVVVTEVANTEAGFDALEELLGRHQVQRVGIEGSGNYGRGAAVRLVLTGGLEVVEVPPSLTSRERAGRPGAGKTDPGDAVAIARITARARCVVRWPGPRRPSVASPPPRRVRATAACPWLYC